MRSLFVIVGVVVVLLLLFSSGTITGNLCARNVGCVTGNGDGLRLDPDASTPVVTAPAQ